MNLNSFTSRAAAAAIAIAFTLIAAGPVSAANNELIESWENTLDGWQVPSPGNNTHPYPWAPAFDTVNGVTNGTYSLSITGTGTSGPNYGQMCQGPSSVNLTDMLARAQSINLDIFTPPGSFGFFLQFDFDITGAVPYQSLERPQYTYIGTTIGSETTITVPIPSDLRAALASSTVASQLIIQIGGGFTSGNETMYLDNFRTALLTNYNWTDTSGSWSSGSGWQEGVTPDQTENGNVHGAGTTVTFSSATVNRTVTLDSNHTVGHIVFNNPNVSYTIAPGSGGTLTIDNSAVTFSDTGNTTMPPGVPDITIAAGNHTISAPLAMANGLTVKPASGTSLTLSGGLSGTGPLVIGDAGKVVMTAASTHTGGTNINAGTLQIAGLAGAGTVNVGSGGTLSGTGAINGLLSVQSGGTVEMRTLPSAVDTLSPSGGFTLSDSTNLGFDIGATADSIDVGGNAFTFSGSGKATVNLGLIAGFHNGDFNLIANAPGISLSEFQLGSPIPGFASTLQISGSNLQVHLVATATTTAYWRGGRVSGSPSVWTAIGTGGATNWDTSQTSNVDSGLPSTPSDVFFAANAATAANMANTTLGADITINSLQIATTNPVGIGGANTLTINNGLTINSGAGTTTISSNVGLGLAQTWANNSTNKATISGVVGGGASAALMIAGTGSIRLTGNNTFTGGTTVTSGTLEIGHNHALGADGATVVHNGGTIEIDPSISPVWSLSGSLGSQKIIALAGVDPTLTLQTGGAPKTYGGSIQNGTGVISVVVSGGGMQIFTGANTYTGGTTINAGATLQLGDGAGHVGSITGTVQSDGILAFAGDGTTSPGTGDQVFPGNISGAGGVTSINPGTVTLLGNNIYSGTTTVLAGTLAAGSTTAFGMSNLTIGAAGTVDLSGKSVSVAALSGSATSNTNRSIITNNDPGTGTATLTITAGGQFAGSISDGPTAKTALLVSGGTLILTSVSPTTYGGTPGVNTFTGGVTVSPGATLQLGNFDGGQGQTVSPSPVLGGGPVTLGGGASVATLNLNWQGGGGVSNYFLPNPISLNGNAAVNDNEGNTHLSGAVSVSGAGNALSITYTDKDLALDGPISGSGTITARGNDTTNLYSGGGKLFIGSQVGTIGSVDNSAFTGTLNLDETSALGTPSTHFSGVQLVIVDNAGLPNATVTMNGSFTAMTNIGGMGVVNTGYQSNTGTIAFAGGAPSATTPAIGALSSTTGGDFQLSTAFGEPVTLTLGKNNLVPVSFAGVISDGIAPGGSIIKVGTGTQILAAVNTYTGPTTISAGRLGLGAANAIATTSQVVLGGGTLDTGGFAQDFTTSAAPATLALNASSTLDLGAATSPASVKFAGSSGVSWAGTLTIAGWTYSTDHLIIGGNASGLTNAQRGQITFSHFLPGAVISATGEVTPHPFDINQDSHVDVADVSAAMAGLSNITTYISAHPGFTLSDATFLLDVNGDGKATNTDVQAMINVLANGGGGSLTAVPEPASWLLLGIGGIALFRRVACRRDPRSFRS